MWRRHPEYRVVDLGTKAGSSLREFLRKGKHHFGRRIKGIQPHQCLGVDRQEKYRGELEELGYQFRVMNILQSSDFPQADYYLAWDFLEHLPSIEDSSQVLEAMLQHSARGIWIRMPSFEQDEQGEGQLRQHGLRFTWTRWKGHPSPYKLSDAKEVLHRVAPRARIEHLEQRIIEDSTSEFLVPIDSPLDTVKYTPALGKKPEVQFEPPIIGCHELVVSLRR